ncbi:hypothetical protein SDC9_199754 [bioreactor metagenome]|uniref:Uncharacterized protein n=1 Tax=bioreactor metagenome TaxID=1076179 RepID=A0A645ILX8_9ZZZZ
MAISTTVGLNAEMSTLNKNLRLSFAPGRVKALILHIIINKNSTGISVFVIFSIPFLTPNIKIVETTTIIMICHTIGDVTPKIVFPNFSPADSAVTLLKSPFKILNTYE